METRKCNYCGGAIPSDKRADSKYCSNSCKANHWEESKGKQPVTNKAIPPAEKPKLVGQPLDGIRGVIENQPKIAVTAVKEPSIPIVNEPVTPMVFKRETQAYKGALAYSIITQEEYARVQKINTNCENNLKEWREEIGRLRRLQQQRPANIDAYAFLDRFGYIDAREEAIQNKLKQAQEHLDINIGFRPQISNMLAAAKKKYDEAQQKLQSILRYEVVKPIPAPPSTALLKAQPELPREQEPIVAEEVVTESAAIIPSNGKLISSQELRGINYKCLNFQGRWKEFFGLPAVVFHLAVHGKPGEGKSTFCIQFADYLAKNFGNVVYVSGEEGFSKTLRDKVVNNGINNPYLFFADISSYEEIEQEIEDNKFHFIFIDSLDTLRIDTARLRSLREHYPQSAFITISQSTKDGKMRGSQEIIHDTDIAAAVENGVATTTKNRFHPRGTEFSVFPTQQKPAPKKINEIRNVI